ncbi:MAG: MBL fold metallo-hydrolase, partial [Proteobacteria bacterium]|nr:MBL fold metallo-hydrolase [Pseudomonadota bacterium]
MRTIAVLLGSLLAAAPVTAPADERISELIERGLAPVRTERVHERIWLAVGNSNSYRIVTDAGSVIFDTGLHPQAIEQKAALEAVAPGPVRYAILSHAHGDHTGGAELWREAGAKVVAHRLFRQRAGDRERLSEFDTRRDSVLWGRVLETLPGSYRAVEPDSVVDERWDFQLGDLSFQVLHMTGGEGPDGIALWVPEIRALFVGDMFGAILNEEGAFPNLFTLRGETLREAVPYIETLERVLALEPELILPGHFEPVVGREVIQKSVGRLLGAVRYVHDATVAGMNEGRSLWELMREVELPPELAVNQQYGRVPWGVRAIW